MIKFVLVFTLIYNCCKHFLSIIKGNTAQICVQIFVLQSVKSLVLVAKDLVLKFYYLYKVNPENPSLCLLKIFIIKIIFVQTSWSLLRALLIMCLFWNCNQLIIWNFQLMGLLWSSAVTFLKKHLYICTKICCHEKVWQVLLYFRNSSTRRHNLCLWGRNYVP